MEVDALATNTSSKVLSSGFPVGLHFRTNNPPSVAPNSRIGPRENISTPATEVRRQSAETLASLVDRHPEREQSSRWTETCQSNSDACWFLAYGLKGVSNGKYEGGGICQARQN